MLRRPILLLTVLALVASACTYESSGTTTTTFVDPADLPPSMAPSPLTRP